MSRCIQVKLSDGSYVSANVDDNVDKLPQSDIDALEAWVLSVKLRHARKKRETLTDEEEITSQDGLIWELQDKYAGLILKLEAQS